jgi:hypothetical protein
MSARCWSEGAGLAEPAVNWKRRSHGRRGRYGAGKPIHLRMPLWSQLSLFLSRLRDRDLATRYYINRSFWEFARRSGMGKEEKTDAELEDMILQRLVIGGVFVSVRRDPVLGWRPTVVTAPKHTKNAQELADKIAAELRKKFTLKD